MKTYSVCFWSSSFTLENLHSMLSCLNLTVQKPTLYVFMSFSRYMKTYTVGFQSFSFTLENLHSMLSCLNLTVQKPTLYVFMSFSRYMKTYTVGFQSFSFTLENLLSMLFCFRVRVENRQWLFSASAIFWIVDVLWILYSLAKTNALSTFWKWDEN